VTRFDWDEHKNRTNRNKHGIGFETAVGVFADPNAIARVERVVDGEERWQTIGCLENGTLVILLVHTLAGKDCRSCGSIDFGAKGNTSGTDAL
jgi:uncharacterized protein